VEPYTLRDFVHIVSDEGAEKYDRLRRALATVARPPLRLVWSTALQRAAAWCSAALPLHRTLMEPAPQKNQPQNPQGGAEGARFPIALSSPVQAGGVTTQLSRAL